MTGETTLDSVQNQNTESAAHQLLPRTTQQIIEDQTIRLREEFRQKLRDSAFLESEKNYKTILEAQQIALLKSSNDSAGLFTTLPKTLQFVSFGIHFAQSLMFNISSNKMAAQHTEVANIARAVSDGTRSQTGAGGTPTDTLLWRYNKYNPFADSSAIHDKLAKSNSLTPIELKYASRTAFKMMFLMIGMILTYGAISALFKTWTISDSPIIKSLVQIPESVILTALAIFMGIAANFFMTYLERKLSGLKSKDADGKDRLLSNREKLAFRILIGALISGSALVAQVYVSQHAKFLESKLGKFGFQFLAGSLVLLAVQVFFLRIIRPFIRDKLDPVFFKNDEISLRLPVKSLGGTFEEKTIAYKKPAMKEGGRRKFAMISTGLALYLSSIGLFGFSNYFDSAKFLENSSFRLPAKSLILIGALLTTMLAFQIIYKSIFASFSLDEKVEDIRSRSPKTGSTQQDLEVFHDKLKMAVEKRKLRGGLLIALSVAALAPVGYTTFKMTDFSKPKDLLEPKNIMFLALAGFVVGLSLLIGTNFYGKAKKLESVLDEGKLAQPLEKEYIDKGLQVFKQENNEYKEVVRREGNSKNLWNTFRRSHH